jgi:transketolase
MAVEAASPFGWERFVGLDGTVIGIDRFGASAPAEVLAEKFGFTAEAVERRLREALA